MTYDKFYLQVKCRSLQLISELFPINLGNFDGNEKSKEVENVVKLIGSYTHSQVCIRFGIIFNVIIQILIEVCLQDARVRCEAFQSLLTLQYRGLNLDPSLYDLVCPALSDDYESVRQVALRIVCLLGNKHPEQ